MNHRFSSSIIALTVLHWPLCAAAPASIDPPCYLPDQGDIVITNGRETFNRPLYCGHGGARLEAGDHPQFAFYDQGRGGNVRIAVRGQPNQPAFWLDEAATVEARYRAGSMLYAIRDPRMGDANIALTVIPVADGVGAVLRIHLENAKAPVRLLWAFGGANGEKGRRNGDLNAEREPLSRFFQLKPDDCRDHQFHLKHNAFSVTSANGTWHGRSSLNSTLKLADASHWESPEELLSQAVATTTPSVVIGTCQLESRHDLLLAFQRKPDATSLPDLLARAEHARQQQQRVQIHTPDPHINAAMSALNVAADAIWDENLQRYMHGAIGWRMPLLGWRGCYAGDALGQHQRTLQHITGFAAKQNNSPVPATLPPADLKYQLSRSETAINSHGNFIGSNLSHYDMNSIAIDALFRHLQWTGNRATAERLWPVLEKHFAWQRRLFRRPFPDENSPLYEGYACIWASDQLMYSGGGATHATAYNLYHNRMAARIAQWLGHDATPYQREAAAIAATMKKQLWLNDLGWYAECKDFLGKQSVLPSPALWTFYHTVDSAAANPFESWQMTRFLDTEMKKIPMRVRGVADDCFQLATTNWHPYSWSVNNVALAESAHTALALWQAQRPDLAFPLFKGALLDTMFMGACPGNLGMTTKSDAYSQERYRDFADGTGITARAFIEGLFGWVPLLVDQTILVKPQFPASWQEASIKHPDFSLSYQRSGNRETYRIAQHLSASAVLRLNLPARGLRVEKITLNGEPVRWNPDTQSIDQARIEALLPIRPQYELTITWQAGELEKPTLATTTAWGSPIEWRSKDARIIAVQDPQGILADLRFTEQTLSATAQGTIGSRCAFVQLQQGDLKWWQSLSTEIRPALEVIAAEQSDAQSLRFIVRNHSTQAVQAVADVTCGLYHKTLNLDVPAMGDSAVLSIPSSGFAPGQHTIRLALPQQPVLEGVVTHWHLPASHSQEWEKINLSSHFNDQVSNIFKHHYDAPRSPFCSLALPRQGIGGWCLFQTTAEIDDSGLRRAAAPGDEWLSPLGIPFRTPSDAAAPNVVFVSRWDNFPDQIDIPLTGQAKRVCLLMAGSTNWMQSRRQNGHLRVFYSDGTSTLLKLENPTNWWPIDQDYFIDNHAFARPQPVPPRVDLKTAKLRLSEPSDFTKRGATIPGGAATILDLELDPTKTLSHLHVEADANDVVIGVLSLSLQREHPPK